MTNEEPRYVTTPVLTEAHIENGTRSNECPSIDARERDPSKPGQGYWLCPHCGKSVKAVEMTGEVIDPPKDAA